MSKKGYKQTEESRKKISDSLKGRIFNEEHKKNLSRAIKGRKLPKEWRMKIGKSLKGHRHTEETKRKLSLNHRHYQTEEAKRKISLAKMGKKNPNYGKKLSEETKRKISLANRGRKMPEEHKKRLILINTGYHHTEEVKKRLSMRNKGRGNPFYGKHHTKETLQKIFKCLQKRPTSFEKKIIDLCLKYKLPFLYTGDGRTLINFKNPDFINEENKIVIEVFYSWFKVKNYGSVKKYKEFCRKKYSSAGWKVIFIDENNLNKKNWEEVCLEKIHEKKLLEK